MNPFFVSSGPEDPGDPDRHGRPDRPASAEATGTADPADCPDRRPRRPTGEDPAGDRRPRPTLTGGPGEAQIGSAMRYRQEQQRVKSGAALLLEVSEAHGDGLNASGDGGLLLEKGRYLCSFAADAEGTGDCGAVFALNGATLPFTASLLPDGERVGRLALTAVLDLRASAILTVENNCGGDVLYRNAVLTAIRLF